jgi:hypothetical protein
MALTYTYNLATLAINTIYRVYLRTNDALFRLFDAQAHPIKSH